VIVCLKKGLPGGSTGLASAGLWMALIRGGIVNLENAPIVHGQAYPGRF